MNMIFAANSLVWPLVFLLFGLLVLRQLRDDVRPIFSNLVTGLAAQSGRYSGAWAMALLYACAASFQALAEVATAHNWVYVAAFAKVAQPGLVAIIAFVTRPPNMQPNGAVTNPPFASTNPAK